jgi:hypothetical protein
MGAVDRDELTLVTALFDVRGRERRERGAAGGGVVAQDGKIVGGGGGGGEDPCKGAEAYLKLGQRVLAWDANLVVLTEPKFAGEILRARKQFGLLSKTLVLATDIEQSRYFWTIAKLKALYAAGKVPRQYWAPKDTPLYVWCMFQKADALMRAMEVNPFGSSRFFWVDLGIYHVATPPQPSVDALLDQLAAPLHDRVRMTALRHLDAHETVDPRVFYSQLQQCFAGGLFGGSLSAMRWFVGEWDREIAASLEHYPVFDQAMFARIYNRNPSKFLTVNGHIDGHRTLLQPRTDRQTADHLTNAVLANQFAEAECYASEFAARPWHADNPWSDRGLQRIVLANLARAELALAGGPHPHTSAAIRLLSASPLAPPTPSAALVSANGVDTKMMTVGKRPPVITPVSAQDEAAARRAESAARTWTQKLTEVAASCSVLGYGAAAASAAAAAAVANPNEAARVRDFVRDWVGRPGVVGNLSSLNIFAELLAAAHAACPPSIGNLPGGNLGGGAASAAGAAPGGLRRVPMWVVNLDHRRDRWLNMQRTIRGLGGDCGLLGEVRRFRAIHGEKERAYLQGLSFW